MPRKVACYACIHCGKVFVGSGSKKLCKEHEKKLGKPSFAFAIGFTLFVLIPSLDEEPIRVEVVGQGVDNEHFPEYRLRNVETGEVLEGWFGEDVIYVELSGLYNRVQPLGGA